MSEIFNKNKGLLYWLTTASLASLIMLLWVYSANAEEIRTMTFENSAEIEVKPDVATINITASTEAKTQKEAEAKLREQVKQVMNTLDDFDIEEKDIKTINMNSSPISSIIPSQNNIFVSSSTLIFNGDTTTSYLSSEVIKVKVRKTENIEKLKTKITNNSVTIGDIIWEVDNADKYKQEVRVKAIEATKQEAKQIAKDLGLNLGKVRGFSVYYDMGNNNGMYPMVKSSLDMENNSGIRNGVNKIKATTNITYTIK